MKYVKSIIFFILLIPFFVFGHTKDTLDGASTWRFSENKGQWESNIKYKSQIRGGAFFLENNQFTIVIEDIQAINRLVSFKYKNNFLSPSTEPIDYNVKAHAYQMEFLGSNPNPEIIPQKAFPDYENYFLGNDSKKWKSKVNAYEEVVYHNLYPGVDVKAYSDHHYFKYDVIIAPFSSTAQVKIGYKGTNGLSLTNGNLVIKTCISDNIEMKPYAYQIIDGNKSVVECNFVLSGTTVGFQLGDYDKSKPLIIDPVLVFSTYSGSTADNWGYTATYDKDGYLYSGGSVFGIGYPTTIGAFQTAYNGGNCDISITKFNTAGNSLIYSTYLGGSACEVPNSLVVNENNELYVLGTTGSGNYPTTIGCYDPSFNFGSNYTLTYVLQYTTGSDIVISKFSADGQSLLGSTYFGGSGNDGLNMADTLKKNYADDVRGEIMVDANSNVYVVSSTKSVDLPVSANAFQPTYGGGKQDGCIIKFNQNLSNLIWASYLGGSKSDACYSIQLDSHNDIYVAGGTSSDNFPITQGVIQPTYQGGVCDGFITLINENGTTILASSYYGSIAYDQVYLTKTDRNGNVYLFGQTAATGNIFIQNAIWNRPSGGQFLSKLTKNLQSIVWSTAYGTGNGGPDISPTALLVDFCNNIYMSGWGGLNLNGFGGTSGMPITPDAFQSTTDNHDYYFIVVKDDASALVYATFFGGGTSHEHVDGGTSRFDKKGRIYQAVCAGCGSNDDFPTTAGAWSNINNSFNCNMGVIKFNFDVPALIADFDAPSIVCAPINVTFQNNSQTVTTGTTVWQWDFGDNTTSTLQNPSHTYTQSGQYLVRLIVSNLISCNTADTAYKTIIVLSNTRDTLPDKQLCFGEFIQIGIPPSGNNAITYNWQPPTNLSNITISNPIATPTSTTNYMLRISDGVCTDTLMQKVNVYNILVDAGANKTVCRGDTVNLTAISSGGATEYLWAADIGFSTILNSNTSSPIFRPVINQTITYYVKAKNSFCDAIDSITLTMSFADIASTSPYTICYGDTLTLNATNLNPLDPVNYQWTPTSPITSGGNTATPSVSPTISTNFVVTGSNVYGCKDTVNVFVNVLKIESTNIINDVKCHGQCNGNIQLAPSSGIPPYNYTWSHNPLLHSNNATGLCVGNYQITISDQQGCKLTLNQAISQPDSLILTFIDTTHVVCNGVCGGMARAITNGGIQPYQYNWITGATTDSITSLCAGVYSLTVTDQNQCPVTSSIQITDTSSFNATASLVLIRCFLECNGQAAIIASAGVPPYQYQWNNGSSNDTLFNLCSGIYNATVTESNGCVRNVYANITQPTPLKIELISQSSPSCYGNCTGSISVHGVGGTAPYHYQWVGNILDSTNANLCIGTYSVSVTDAHGCTFDTSFTITQPDALSAIALTTKVPCSEVCIGNASVTLTGGVPPYHYLWDNGGTNSSTTGLCFGNHNLLISDSHSCNLSLNVYIADTSYFPSQVVAWANPDTIYESQSTQLGSTNIPGFLYTWSPSTALSNIHIYNPIATPSHSSEYVVVVNDQFGCAKSDTVYIYVKDVICDEPYVYVPNAFTPNSDQKNDVLKVRSEIITDVYFAIYDRWGEKVFETTDMNKGWDGTFRGKKCDPAVYVYYIDATCITKEKYIKKGNITLIK
jgi:gliding motility-associated-like protein